MKLIDPFLDPVTRSKISVNRQLITEGDVTPDQMIKELGGEREFVWDCDRYMKKLVEISGKMKEKRLNKWRELGGKVGLREWDYKEESGFETVQVPS
jgi:translation initiation factor IF-1